MLLNRRNSRSQCWTSFRQTMSSSKKSLRHPWSLLAGLHVDSNQLRSELATKMHSIPSQQTFSTPASSWLKITGMWHDSPLYLPKDFSHSLASWMHHRTTGRRQSSVEMPSAFSKELSIYHRECLARLIRPFSHKIYRSPPWPKIWTLTHSHWRPLLKWLMKMQGRCGRPSRWT